MKKVSLFLGMLCACHLACAEEILAEEKIPEISEETEKNDYKIHNEQNENNDEFQRFGEPYRVISGAYWGFGFGLSRTQHKIEFAKLKDDGKIDGEKKNHTSSGMQSEISFLMGFGAPIYKRYYAGMEIEFFDRLGGKTTDYDDKLHVHHCKNMSLNFEGRFGYLLPESGNLVFMTAGVSRIFGRVSFGDEKKPTSSFGSFFPTVGLGFEHRINYNWNWRVDYHYVISSKDNDHKVKTGSKDAPTSYTYQGKANRMALRLVITRSINSSWW